MNIYEMSGACSIEMWGFGPYFLFLSLFAV